MICIYFGESQNIIVIDDFNLYVKPIKTKTSEEEYVLINLINVYILYVLRCTCISKLYIYIHI